MARMAATFIRLFRGPHQKHRYSARLVAPNIVRHCRCCELGLGPSMEYDHEIYKRRNEVERLFQRLKGFRRIFWRLEKLEVMFMGFSGALR